MTDKYAFFGGKRCMPNDTKNMLLFDMNFLDNFGREAKKIELCKGYAVEKE